MSPPARKWLIMVISCILFFSSDFSQAVSSSQSDVPVFPEDTSPRFKVKQVRISGNSLIPTEQLLEELPSVYTVTRQKDNTIEKELYDFTILSAIISEPGREREISRKTIQGFTEYLLSVYKEKGYAGIYVYVPAKAVKAEAELQDGILQINVLEGRVWNITVKSYDFDRLQQEPGYLKSSAVESWSPVKQGQVVQKNKVDEFVRLLNVDPDRYVSAVISRSDEPDSLDLQYDIYEANPWHWYLQVDNAGTKDRQWSPRLGVVNTNLTGIDDNFALMYQANTDSIDENYALFGSYELPVFSPRLRLGVYAGYTEFDITPATGAGINFLGNGSFYGGTLRYNVFQMKDWLFDFVSSLSSEQSKVTPSIGLKSDVETDLFGFGTEIHRTGDMSRTNISFNVQNSFGGSSNNKFQNARINSDPDFTIYTASLSHKQFMDRDKIHELSGTFRGIFPDERLIPAKMTPFGGLYTVRGYEENEIVADGGIIASFQYRFDLTRHENPSYGIEQDQSGFYTSEETWPPNISILGFTDYGQAKIKDHVAGEKATHELWGAGVGTLLEVGDDFDAALYYAWPLQSVDGTKTGNGKLNLSFIYRW